MDLRLPPLAESVRDAVALFFVPPSGVEGVLLDNAEVLVGGRLAPEALLLAADAAGGGDDAPLAFTLVGDGRAGVPAGAIVTAAGLAEAEGGFPVTTGVKGVAGVLVVTTGVTTAGGGLTVTTGFTDVTGGLMPITGGLAVTGGLMTMVGGLTTGGVTGRTTGICGRGKVMTGRGTPTLGFGILIAGRGTLTTGFGMFTVIVGRGMLLASTSSVAEKQAASPVTIPPANFTFRIDLSQKTSGGSRRPEGLFTLSLDGY